MMLTYKSLHGQAPNDLAELLHPYTPNRRLCSSQLSMLVVPKTRLKSMGDGPFSFYAPFLWKSLPLELREDIF